MNDTVRRYDFKNGLPLKFEIISVADLYSKNRDIVTKPHRANFYHIIWVQKGNISHFVDFNSIQVHSDSLLFIPKDCIHVFDAESEYEGQIILFTDDFFCITYDDVKFLKSTILFNDLLTIAQIKLSSTGNPLVGLLKIIQEEYFNPSDFFQHSILKNLLHSFLLIAERERRMQDFQEIRPSADLKYLLQFKDLLEENFRENKFVYKYAEEIGITPRRLTRATVEILSMSPKHMIDERIMLEAKRLLVHTSMNIKEISNHLGFDEPTNFNKFFRNTSGITPAEFRLDNS